MSSGTLCIAQGIVFFWVCAVTVHAQVPLPEQFTLFDGERVFQADGSRGPFAISDRAIEAASERVWVDGVLFIRDRDYVVDADRALLTLLRDVARGVEIVVRFRQRPLVTAPVVQRRQFQPGKAAVINQLCVCFLHLLCQIGMKSRN